MQDIAQKQNFFFLTTRAGSGSGFGGEIPGSGSGSGKKVRIRPDPDPVPDPDPQHWCEGSRCVGEGNARPARTVDLEQGT